MAPLCTAVEIGDSAGYAGPAAAEAISKFIIVVMYAKAVPDASADGAVKWAHDEMVKVYTRNKQGNSAPRRGNSART